MWYDMAWWVLIEQSEMNDQELVGTRKMIHASVVAQQDYFGDAFELVHSDNENVEDGGGGGMGDEL